MVSPQCEHLAVTSVPQKWGFGHPSEMRMLSFPNLFRRVQCMPQQPVLNLKVKFSLLWTPILLNGPFLWSEASHTVSCKVNGPAALWSSLNSDHLLLASVTPQTPGTTRQHFIVPTFLKSVDTVVSRESFRVSPSRTNPSRIARATDQTPWLLDTISDFLIHLSVGFLIQLWWSTQKCECFSSQESDEGIRK